MVSKDALPVGSQITLYKYTFAESFKNGLNTETIQAEVCERENDPDRAFLVLKGINIKRMLAVDDLGKVSTRPYYMVILAEDDLDLAKSLVTDKMQERIAKLEEDIALTEKRIKAVAAATS